MTQLKTISMVAAILAGATLAACGTENADGQGSNFSGSNGTGGSDGGSDGGGDGGGGGSDGGGGGVGSGATDPDANTQPTYPTQHPRIFVSKNSARLKAALQANTPAAARFKSVVDSWVGGEDIWGFESWNGALMGQLTNDPKYCNKAVQVVEAQVSAAESAIASGGTPVVAGDSYLEIGSMIADVALTYDWCNGNLSASQKTRWLAYADQAVSNVWHPTTAKWGSHSAPWTGWATNDPSDNYYYSFLRATMLLGLAAKGEDPQADGWVTQFRQTKVLGQLVPEFNSDLVGGGSREGTGYGVAMRNLWELYAFWHDTTGESLAGKTTHTRASMLSFMHQIMPTEDRVAPTGDLSRDSTAAFFDYHRHYLQQLISLYPADPLSKRAKTMLDHASVPKMGQMFMAVDDFLWDTSVSPVAVDLNTTYYAKGIGQLYARSGWDTHATWFNLTGGPYTQSHAHQDQGSIMLYKDGWLAYDAVIDSSSGLRQETTAHSLVRIDNGSSPIGQVASTISQMVAVHRGADWVYASADLTPAYDGNGAIQKVQRDTLFLQPNIVVVYDRVKSSGSTRQVWQLMTPKSPSVSGDTATINGGTHTLTVKRLAPSGASMSSHGLSGESDYHGGYRLEDAVAGGDQRMIHVLSIDGAATTATAQGDTVTVTTGGKTATIVFNHDAPGASLTWNGATKTLAAGIDTLNP
jgi:hypothetical protein